jgi:hypothetical protein
MERLRTHEDWHTQVIPISLSGDRLKQVAIDNGDGCVHPSAHTEADSHDQPRSRPRCIDVRRASAGEWCVRESCPRIWTCNGSWANGIKIAIIHWIKGV